MTAFSGPEGFQVPKQRITAETEYTGHPKAKYDKQ